LYWQYRERVDKVKVNQATNVSTVAQSPLSDSVKRADYKTASSSAMAPAVVIELSSEKVAAGYDEVSKSMKAGRTRGAAISKFVDQYENMEKVGMLAASVGPKSGPTAAAVELSSIRRDTLQMMNNLPPNVSIKLADQIREQIARGEWPTDKDKINQKIKEIVDLVI